MDIKRLHAKLDKFIQKGLNQLNWKLMHLTRLTLN